MREFLELAAAHAGVDWKKCVEKDPRYFRPTEVDSLQGDASKARRALGWKPEISFDELVKRWWSTTWNWHSRNSRWSVRDTS